MPIDRNDRNGDHTVVKQRVLVVDDDEDVLFLVEYALKRLGFDVTCASDGPRAVELYRRGLAEGQRFDAVIMDLNIPGSCGGKELVARLLELDPRVRAFISSGYPDDPCMTDFRRFGFAGAIAKPVTYEELLAAFVPAMGLRSE